jgi:hypothetical protein
MTMMHWGDFFSTWGEWARVHGESRLSIWWGRPTLRLLFWHCLAYKAYQFGQRSLASYFSHCGYLTSGSWVHPSVWIGPMIRLDGFNIWIEKEARIQNSVTITGPYYIGAKQEVSRGSVLSLEQSSSVQSVSDQHLFQILNYLRDLEEQVAVLRHLNRLPAVNLEPEVLSDLYRELVEQSKNS